MELKKLILKNFRSHKRFAVDFKSGVSAIVGENGTGKSSLVEAIIFLFTGEGFGYKSDLLSVGEVSGYVLGHINIDGKEAILERHLDTSKVSLKYDGIVYKKSSEVSELWEKLFQIDKNIFKNVIVARQGDIPLLFSGDNSSKEKIFQKIFMVPNTGKLRDLIWDKYIKTAPPEYSLVDARELESRVVELQTEIEIAETELKKIPESLDALRMHACSRMNYLNTCLESSSVRDTKQVFIKQIEESKAAITADFEEAKLKLKNINIAEVNELLAVLKTNKPLFEKSEVLKAQLKEQETKKEIFSTAESAELTFLENELKEFEAKQTLLQLDANNLHAQLSEYHNKGLLGKTNCPTCGSTLDNVAQLIEHLQLKLTQNQSILQSNKKSIEALLTDAENLKVKKLKACEYDEGVKNFQNKLEALGDYAFDSGAYELYSAVVVQYNKISAEQELREKEISKHQQDILRIKLELATLPEYDKAKKDIHVEKEELTEKLNDYARQYEMKLVLLQKIAADRKVLDMTLEQLEKNKILGEKNSRRKKYLSVLQAIYDMFATSQFPRKLIQTYTEAVSVYLSENLQRFSFPYNVKVNDSFGIDVLDDGGRQLPSVSGGQEIMIGIALRLALHSMFGAAFPMFILDEGSVHLSQESKKSYFQIIQELKKASDFKQIIIIDHDEELSSVVDNTIKLN